MGLLDLKQIKCKTCGEPLDMNTANDGVIVCGVCDSRFTLPKFTAEQKVIDCIFQAEGDLDTGRFDDAYTKFAKAAELDKTEPEAYFGMALAEYKIQYLKDEVNNRLQPICHEINDKDFADSPNFLKALRYATEAQRGEYERKGNEINYIKNEFYKIAQSGVKYDCFICVKVSDTDGGRTADYKTADDIYFELKGKGYKPFFSERELGGVTGADYEARILYALYSCECMLVVCFDEAYLRTKWVKNEYTRFLKLVNDEEKESDSIALVFGNRPIEKLPNKHGKIQGIAINSLTAMERIVSFVDNHTPEAKRRREEIARRKTAEDEAQRKKIAEQEERLKQQEERFKQLEEMLKAQQEARKAEEERAKNEAAAAAAKQPEAPKAAPKTAPKTEPKPAPKKEPKTEPKNAPENSKPGSFVDTVKRKITDEAKRIADEAKRFAEEQAKKEAERKAAEEAARKAAEEEARKKAETERVQREKEEAARKAVAAELKLKNERYEVWLQQYFSIDKDNQILKKYRGVLPELEVPNGIKELGLNAFMGQNIRKVTLPNSLEKIGQNAFSGCSELKEIIIPKDVNFIGNASFCNCTSLESVTFTQGCFVRIDKNAFWCCSALKKFVTYGRISSIGEGAFAGCAGIVQKMMGIYYLDKWVVGSDKPLNKVIFVSRPIEIICDNAFYTCSFTEITIPEGVKHIGANAFYSCSKLEKIKLPNSLESIGKAAFSHCRVLKSVSLPKNVKSIGDEAFSYCEALESVNLSKGLTQIGGYAFNNCISLKKIEVPDGVKSIEWFTFQKCSSLKSVKLPKSVENVGYGAFTSCTELKQITLSVKFYGDINGAYCVHLDENLKKAIQSKQCKVKYLK